MTITEIIYLVALGLIIVMSIMGILSTFFLYFYFQSQVKILLIPILNFVLLIMHIMFVMLQSMATTSETAYFFGSLAVVTMSVFLSVGVWFILSFEGQWNYFKIAYSSSVPFTLIFVFLLEIQTGLPLMIEVNTVGSLYVAEWTFFVGFLLVSQGVATGYWYYTGLKRIKNYVVDPTQDKQLRRMQSGVILGFFIGPLMRLVGDTLILAFGENLAILMISWSLGAIMIAFGTILAVAGYFSGRRIEFLKPQKQHSINRYMNFLFHPAEN